MTPMTDELEQRARAAAIELVGYPKEYSFESLTASDKCRVENYTPFFLAFASQERQAVWEENMKMACRLCRQGYPLQENGSWHNDKLGRDSMVNNACLSVGIRDQARKERGA